MSWKVTGGSVLFAENKLFRKSGERSKYRPRALPSKKFGIEAMSVNRAICKLRHTFLLAKGYAAKKENYPPLLKSHSADLQKDISYLEALKPAYGDQADDIQKLIADARCLYQEFKNIANSVEGVAPDKQELSSPIFLSPEQPMFEFSEKTQQQLLDDSFSDFSKDAIIPENANGLDESKEDAQGSQLKKPQHNQSSKAETGGEAEASPACSGNQEVAFMFEHVQKLKEIGVNDEAIFSPACIIENLQWRILIDRKAIEDSEYECIDAKETLALKVQVSQSTMWFSYARIRLTVLSQKDGVESFSKEFENLFSSLNSMCGYSDFMEWDSLINPNNGFIKDNILKIQAHIVADIPLCENPDINRELPKQYADWVALFEKSLNDKIVERISAEFIRMNSVFKTSLKNKEISEKLINAAINPVNTVINTEVQVLEKKLEKFCRTHIARIINEIKNVKLKEKIEKEAKGIDTNEPEDIKADYESIESCAGKEMNKKNIGIVEEETIPVSALKIMKELIVEQQKLSFGWTPSLYGSTAAYYRTKELHSYQAEPARDSEDCRFSKSILKPLAYEKGTDSDTTTQQPENLNSNKSESGSSEMNGMNGENPNLLQKQLQKNEKRQKKGEDLEDHFENISNHANKPIVVHEEITELTNQFEKEVLFCGKTFDGEVEVYKVASRQYLPNLTEKKYKSYKFLNLDDF